MSPIRWPKRRGHSTGPKERTLFQRAYRRKLYVACAYGAGTLAATIVDSAFGSVHSRDLAPKVTAWTTTALVLVLGILTTRRFASLLGHLVAIRTIRAAGAAVRIITTVVGYVLVLFVVLGELNVSITHLLVGGALTGVILGIAAQQSLGNVFAGIVLLLARPFAVGDHIRVRSGALGGLFDGHVLGMSLTYVTLKVDGAPLKVPNSALLAAAVGPYIEAQPTQPITASTTTVPTVAPSDGNPRR